MRTDFVPATLRALLMEDAGLRRSYLVGGCVRDALLGRPVKDFDIEVYGLGYRDLARLLGRWGRVDLVGRSFGVAKLTLPDGGQHDFSLPRRDSKVGPGHRGFDVEVAPDIDPRQASARRDFTINSLMLDPRTGEVLDFHGGIEDLRAGRLRHTSEAFVEDPLRVLRGMQFASRFGLRADAATIDLCRRMAPAQRELPVERVREEWWKWATCGGRPSAGLGLALETGWLDVHPELTGMPGVEQDPEWHPEGDVWRHTLHVVDAMARQAGWVGADERTRGVLMFAALLHDAGKAGCTRREWRHGRERIVSPGHEVAGVGLADVFLRRLGMPNDVLARVPPLVGNHMAHLEEPSARAIRRLALRLAPARIDALCELMTADASGRPPRPAGEPPAVRGIRAKARELSLEADVPKPWVLGRHLLARGMKPGPAFKGILDRAFQAQLDGAFADELGGLRWLDQNLTGCGSRPDGGPHVV